MAPTGHTPTVGPSFGDGAELLGAWVQWLATPPAAGQKLFYSALVERPMAKLGELPAHLVHPAHTDAGPATDSAQALWNELQARWTGMVPGLHRLSLQGGRLELNLWVLGGRTTREDALRQLNDLAPTAKHRPRRIRLATPLATPLAASTAQSPRHALVVGGGLCGAAVAYSLATRGWRVEVLDAAAAPASGASGLPLGLVAPHVSPDDALLSRLTRAGVRATLQRAAALLHKGGTWDLSGSLERRLEHRRALPPATDEATLACQRQWSRDATPAELAAAHLPPETDALWHGHAGWVVPAALVQAQLNHPGIAWRGGQQVARLERRGDSGNDSHDSHDSKLGEHGHWALLDAQERLLAEAPVVVLATAYGTLSLLQGLQTRPSSLVVPPYNPLRGQVSWGLLPVPDSAPPGAGTPTPLPPWPVHGHGSFMQGPGGTWIVGSTFERGATHSRTTPEDHALNRARLAVLLPELAQSPAGAALFQEPRGWAGVRCTLPDRLPTLGEPDPAHSPGLLLCAGMGARGLTLSVLCGEVLAAALHEEPWPLEDKLVRALSAQRFSKARA